MKLQKFDSKRDTPENFLVTFKTKAQRAYTAPDLAEVAPLSLARPDPAPAASGQLRFDSETATRAHCLQADEDHKNVQVKGIFIKAVPGWLMSKIMEHLPRTPVHNLCTFARQQMTIREMRQKEDYQENAFNEVSPCLSENLIKALSKLTANQENMERQIKNMDKNIQAKSSSIDTNKIENNNQLQNINQPRPFTYNSQFLSTTPFNGSCRTSFPNRGKLIRPIFSPRGSSS